MISIPGDDRKWTRDDTESALSVIQYKPGVSFHVNGMNILMDRQFYPHSTHVLQTVIKNLPDSTTPDQHGQYGLGPRVDLVDTQVVPEYVRTTDTFYRWLHTVLVGVETHEIDEWFRVNGRLLHDPHAFQTR